MHEIHTEIDRVLITTNSPLTGIGNWHRLGEEYADRLPRADWLAALGLRDGDNGPEPDGWAIQGYELAPVAAALDAIGPTMGPIINPPPGVMFIPEAATIEGWKALAPTDSPEDIFDIVPSSYCILQNSELADLADIFAEAAQAERGIDIPTLSAGTLRSRRLAFISLGVPDDAALDGLPARGHSLNLGTSHDRTTALVGTLSSTIVVCANTFRANVLGRPAEVNIRHTVGSTWRIVEARGILRDMIGAATEVDAAIARLIDTPMSFPTFRDAALPAILGDRPEDEGRGQTMWDNRREAIGDEYHSERVPHQFHGTAWAAMMAVQGWEQHSRTQRGGRHRAAVAIEKTLTNRAMDGYPATHAFMTWEGERADEMAATTSYGSHTTTLVADATDDTTEATTSDWGEWDTVVEYPDSE
tara:strand:+ start:16364 stop:17611 length:1248 start_codon:yes stop_codon:yes gene_type:complete